MTRGRADIAVGVIDVGSPKSGKLLEETLWRDLAPLFGRPGSAR
jgi:hypothetical protein